ncbi:MAG: LLM class F420-dependent oxidoreductase [Acidobacteria bacterium]|nr:LLM class F420-dependent oxidoreductase [Acidobacteriota bacterium]
MTDFRLDSVGIWTFDLEQIPSARAKEVAAELEDLGYGAIWLGEVAGRDPFVHLTMLLSATSRIVGATGIASIYARDAVTMNEAAQALTEAFPERFLLGLGVSHHNIVEGVRKLTYDKPYSHMLEYLDLLDAAPYSGARPTTPVRRVLAALGPKMLQLAAERTDGAHPYFVPPEHTAEARQLVGPDALLCVEQMVLLDTDPASAREAARPTMARYGSLPNYRNNLLRHGFTEDDFADGFSDRLIDSIIAWGTVDDCAKRVQAHFDAGADHVCIQVLGAAKRDVPLAQWRELAPAMTSLKPTTR